MFLNGRFVVQSLSGVQRFSMEIAQQLQILLGNRLQILTPPTGSTFLPAAQEIGSTAGQRWEQLQLPRFIKDSYLINLGNTAPILRRRQLVVIHDAAVFEAPAAYGWRFRLWYKLMHSWLGRNGTKVVTVSQSSRQGMAKHLGIPETNISVIPEGADHFDKIKADETCLAQFNLTPGRFVLAVGNLAAHKNLAGLSSLARVLPLLDVQLVVAGHLKGDAFSSNGLSGLPQPAQYIGRVSDEVLKALYANASCYVFPSLYEGYGLPAIEAMHCGCPVIAADIPSLRETCGDAAIYADPRSPDDFARAVTRVINDEDLRAELVTRGLNRTRDRTWRAAAQCLLDILEKELSNPERSR